MITLFWDFFNFYKLNISLAIGTVYSIDHAFSLLLVLHFILPTKPHTRKCNQADAPDSFVRVCESLTNKIVLNRTKRSQADIFTIRAFVKSKKKKEKLVWFSGI